MNRNVESHFSMLPSADIQRSRFDRSQDHKFTFNTGDIIPFFWDEILPGDSYDVTTSKVVRMQTLLAPVMDNLYLDTYWFFVPNRLLWSHWVNLMGENTDSAWIPEIEYSVPQILLQDSYGVGAVEGDGAVKTGDLLDYLGVPVHVSSAGQVGKATYCPEINALPLRAYQKVYEDWFRDENVVDPVNFQTGDTNYYYYQDSYVPHKPYKAAKYHDYFTSALPSAQKGNPVQIPTSFQAGITYSGQYYETGWPVTTLAATDPVFTNHGAASYQPVHMSRPDGSTLDTDAASADYLKYRVNGLYAATTSGGENTAEMKYFQRGSTGVGSSVPVVFDNLFAHPAGNDVSGIFVDVNDLRYAFQLQKLYERDARSGSRYIECIKAHFSVTSPDARLQRSEYLGGNRIAINIHQVTNQSQAENDFLGDLGAMSLTTDKHSDFSKSFVEHGILLGVAVARYDHTYTQGLNRQFSRKSRFDYYWPVFANLGETDIKKKELYLSASETDEKAFGFQERWAEYRYKPNMCSSEMRPGIDNTLDIWHFADYYETAPSLSQEWIEEDKTNVDRTLAVSSELANQFFADIYTKCYATRPMPLYSIPGLIDHH